VLEIIGKYPPFVIDDTFSDAWRRRLAYQRTASQKPPRLSCYHCTEAA
jgi:hypothetical protein